MEEMEKVNEDKNKETKENDKTHQEKWLNKLEEAVKRLRREV